MNPSAKTISADPAMPENNLESPHELVVELARSLHTSGSPAHELENRMELAADALGAPAHFFSTPTSLFVTFDNETHATRLVRVKPAGVNLAKLALLYRLHNEIGGGKLSVREARSQLRTIETTNYDYGDLVNILCHGVTAAGAGVFLGGSSSIVAVAGVLGVVVGVLVRMCERFGQPDHLANLAAGFVATILAGELGFLFPGVGTELTVVASLIVLLPGLGITVSVNELATQNLASGTARMAGALTTMLTLTFGVVMGQGFVNRFFDLPRVPDPEPLGIGWAIAALLPSALAFCILFRARKRDLPWMLLATSIAFFAVRIAGLYLGPLAAAWSAALVVGIASNLFARIRNRPAAIMLMPGLLLLVPGSLGFFGLSALVHNDMESGIRAVFTMTLMAVSLVAGLLVANVVCPVDRQRSG